MNNIGLVGCGGWGKNILRDLLELKAKVFVADVAESARDYALQNGAAGVFASVEELPECDGYVVAVTISKLSRVCLSLLKHRKPIFAEKPLCTSLDDFEILKKHDGSDYIFMMHKWRYHPGIEALRLIAESGEIGSLEQISLSRLTWMNDYHGGDVFWTLAVQDLTIVKHILGYIPGNMKAVKAIRNLEGLPVSLTAIMGSSPAVLLNVSGSHSSKRSGVAIHGSRGTAELYNSLDDHITISGASGISRKQIDTAFPLYLELAEFLGYIRGGAKPKCDFMCARETTDIIVKLRRCAGIR